MKRLSDISLSDFKNIKDIPILFFAILTVDVIVLFLTRASPGFWGSALNTWYDKFGLAAVLSDVTIILIGFLIARYIYTEFIRPKYGESHALFLGLLVLVQFIHDVLFYYLAILPIPKGTNQMMDVFRVYSKGGKNILAGDAGLMIGSYLVGLLYKAMPQEYFVASSAVVSYMLPYGLYQNWK
jgi:hypothetical protein